MPAEYAIHDIVGRTATSTRRRGRTAVTFGADARDYATLYDRALRLSNGLRADGVRPGDRVAVLMGNNHEWVESLFAITLAGATVVPVNVLLRGTEIDHVLRDSGATSLIVDALAEPALPEITEIPERLLTVGSVETPEGVGRTAYDEIVGRGQARLPDVLPHRGQRAMIYYTSGTTGQPKGASHTHSGVLWNAYHQLADAELSDDDVYLLVPSLSWSAGFHDVVLALWWAGGRVAVLPSGGMTLDKIVAGVEDAGATSVLLVPTLLKQLVSSPEHLERLRATPLRRILTGAEPVPQAVIDAVHDGLPGARVVQVYGFSEFPLMTTILSAQESPSYAHKTGRASSIVTLAVRDSEGVIADRGTGEVLVRSPATMEGYYERPEANVEAFRDGWFNTGDVGELDEEGFLTVTGRTKDMIISGGMNVYPREIEEIIYKIDGVGEAAVVGVPDEKWGERTVAIVVSRSEGAVTVEKVREACEAQLSSFKRPREIMIREAPLPRTATGKILKRDLRPWAADELRTPR